MMTGCATPADQDAAISNEQFVGSWCLVSWESTTEGETDFPFGKDATGQLVYTATGQVSVFLSQPNRGRFVRAEAKAGTAAEKTAAFDSCFAYAGTFRVAKDRLIHRVEHCTFPNWIGTEQERFVRFDGDRLILETPPLPAGHRQAVSRLVWERVKS